MSDPVILLRDVQQKTQRHIGIVSALMFIKIKNTGNYKGQIVHHLHVDDVVQCNDGKLAGIRICRAVKRIIQLQQRLSVLTEECAEQAILVLSVDMQSVHMYVQTQPDVWEDTLFPHKNLLYIADGFWLSAIQKPRQRYSIYIK